MTDKVLQQNESIRDMQSSYKRFLAFTFFPQCHIKDDTRLGQLFIIIHYTLIFAHRKICHLNRGVCIF